MSRVDSNSSELDSIKIDSARNSTRVWYEFGSFKVHEQLGSAR